MTIKISPEQEAEQRHFSAVAGLPIPLEKKEYTLAELFNRGQKGVVRRNIGFL